MELSRAVAWITLAVGLVVGGVRSANAEFTVGSVLSEFTLPDQEEKPVTLAYREGKLALTLGSKTAYPRILILHFFQPDCLPCQAQLVALNALRNDFSDEGVFILGIAHRGSPEAVKDLAGQLNLTFPLLWGEGSEVADAFAKGDAMALTDSKGIVRFTQVGYSQEDRPIWKENLKRLLAGQEAQPPTIARKTLKVGDKLPAITLDSLMEGMPLALASQEGSLRFTDTKGQAVSPKATVVFLGRFCAFSREEMVALQKLHERYAKEGLFVSVVGLYPEKDGARSITRELGVTYPVFYGSGSYLEKHYAYGCPAYIADASGTIRYTQIGFEKEDALKYERVIQELIR